MKFVIEAAHTEVAQFAVEAETLEEAMEFVAGNADLGSWYTEDFEMEDIIACLYAGGNVLI